MYKVIMIMTMLLVLYGCGMEPKEEIVEMTIQDVKEFQKLMDGDHSGDQLAVCWNGKKAEVIEDVLDDDEILDGRGGNQGYERIDKETWRTKIFLKGDYRIVEDREECYCAKGKDWELKIEKTEIKQAIEDLSQNEWMQSVTKTDLSQHIVARTENAALYRGLKATDEDIKAGYVLVLEDYFGNSYEISYFGTGNMNDIKMEAMNVIGNFRTVIAY